MEKDRSGPASPGGAEGEALDYPQQLRLLRLAESLGLQPQTVEHLRTNLLPAGQGGPLRIRDEFSFRQGAQLQEMEKGNAGQMAREKPLSIPVGALNELETEQLEQLRVAMKPATGGEGREAAGARSAMSEANKRIIAPAARPVGEWDGSLGARNAQAVERSTLREREAPAQAGALSEQAAAAIASLRDGRRGQEPVRDAREESRTRLDEPTTQGWRDAKLHERGSDGLPNEAAAAGLRSDAADQAEPIELSHLAPTPATPARLDVAVEAERKLRMKIEAEQSWSAFRGEAWNLYETFPSPDIAARLIELAFLYGSASDLDEVLRSLMRETVAFYTLIDSQIRIHLVIKLWQTKKRAVLDGLLFRKDLTLRLLPIERLYCCCSLIAGEEGDRAYKFYRRHDQEIWSALKAHASQLKISESELALALGRLALQAHDENIAIELLESIPRSEAEHQKALDMLLDIRVERDEQGLCKFGQKLQRELDWRGRIGLLDSFLLRMQRYESNAPKDRAALNDILKDPLKWFPETPEAWQGVAEVLLQYQQIEYLLPNILQLFHQRALQFNRPAFDHAIWNEVRTNDFGEPVRNWFWKSVAMLHEFTWTQGQNESLLWDARRLYHEALEHAGKPLALSWPQLHLALLQWIHKSDRLEEVPRQRLMVVVRLIGQAQDIVEADIYNYLTQVEKPSEQVMEALEKLTRERQQWGVEAYILERKAQFLHYTNADLDRMWYLAFRLKRFDQCWRVATLLRGRQALNERLERHWAICGEKKRDAPVLELQEVHVKKVLASFDGYERKLAEAMITIGPLIPELLSILNQHLVAVKKGRSLTEAENEIHTVLERMSWFAQPRRMYSTNPSGMWSSKPPFLASLLDTKWSLLFMALAQRLGITAWDWQLSLLHHQIETLVPRMSRGAELPAPGKVGRWLRALSPLQRKAWYDLAALSRRFDDEQAQSICARLLAKLATTMLQDHSLALASLEKMRAPLRLRWDLEHWIASEPYGEIRRSLGSGAIGQYPEEVYEGKALQPGEMP